MKNKDFMLISSMFYFVENVEYKRVLLKCWGNIAVVNKNEYEELFNEKSD